jgi:hypothetical protein
MADSENGEAPLEIKVAGQNVLLAGGRIRFGETWYPLEGLSAEARELDHVQTWWNRFVAAGMLGVACLFVYPPASAGLMLLCAFGIHRARSARNEYYLHLQIERTVYRHLRCRDPEGVVRVAEAIAAHSMEAVGAKPRAKPRPDGL